MNDKRYRSSQSSVSGDNLGVPAPVQQRKHRWSMLNGALKTTTEQRGRGKLGAYDTK
jgi:hypothetical protein